MIVTSLYQRYGEVSTDFPGCALCRDVCLRPYYIPGAMISPWLPRQNRRGYFHSKRKIAAQANGVHFYTAQAPLASPFGRGGEAKTERGNGCGKPAQSPSVTALPEGEPRGWICWRKKWSISIPIRSIHCFYGRPFNLPPLNYFCFLARYTSGSIMPFTSIFSAQSCRVSTVMEIFSNSS